MKLLFKIVLSFQKSRLSFRTVVRNLKSVIAKDLESVIAREERTKQSPALIYRRRLPRHSVPRNDVNQKCVLMMVLLIALFTSLLQAQEIPPEVQIQLDSLQNAYENAEEDTMKVKLLNDIVWEYKKIGKFEIALQISDSVIAIAKEINFKNGLAQIYNLVGILHENQSDYYHALNYYHKSFKVYKEIGDEIGMAIANGNIGKTYRLKSNLSLALTYLLESLSLFENKEFKKGIAISYSNIGNIYRTQGQNELSLNYYHKAIKLYTDMGNQQGNMAITYHNIGAIHSDNIINYPLALEWYMKALKIHEELNYMKGIALTNVAIGMLYAKMDSIASKKSHEINYQTSIDYYLKAIAIQEEIGDRWGSIYSLNGIGELYLKKESAEEALPFFLEAEEIALEIEAVKELSETKESLSEAYEQMGNNTTLNPSSRRDFSLKALEYYKQYTTLKDSVFNEKSSKEISQMSARYEAEKKEKELEILDAENKVNEEELDNRKYKQYAIGGGFAIVLILLTMVASRFWDKTKVANLLHESNTDLVNKSYELEQKKTELQNLSLVANETHNSVIIADTMGEIQWVNGGFEKMSGYTMDEFKKTRGRTLMEVSANPNFSHLLSECINKKESLVYESLNERKNGDKTWVQSTLTPVIRKDGTLNEIIVIDADITNLKNTLLKVAEKDKDITDSINYASRIQESILIPIEEIQKSYPDCFIIHKQSETVGGLAYFYHQVKDLHYFGTIDCKHKGVGGAFMTMLVTDLLNNIFVENESPSAKEIISSLNSKLKTIKKSSLEKELGFDNIEVNFCCVNTKNRKVDMSQEAITSIRFCENVKLVELKATIEKEVEDINDVLVIGIGNVNVSQKVNT